MRIRKFEFTYGGYFATSYEVTKHQNKLEFRTFDHAPHNQPININLSTDQWEVLASQVIDIVKNWGRTYDTDICDGIQWTVIIETDTSKFEIYGSNNFPDNFDKLLEVIRGISGLESFAEDHDSTS